MLLNSPPPLPMLLNSPPPLPMLLNSPPLLLPWLKRFWNSPPLLLDTLLTVFWFPPPKMFPRLLPISCKELRVSPAPPVCVTPGIAESDSPENGLEELSKVVVVGAIVESMAPEMVAPTWPELGSYAVVPVPNVFVEPAICWLLNSTGFCGDPQLIARALMLKAAITWRSSCMACFEVWFNSWYFISPLVSYKTALLTTSNIYVYLPCDTYRFCLQESEAFIKKTKQLNKIKYLQRLMRAFIKLVKAAMAKNKCLIVQNVKASFLHVAGELLRLGHLGDAFWKVFVSGRV